MVFLVEYAWKFISLGYTCLFMPLIAINQSSQRHFQLYYIRLLAADLECIATTVSLLRLLLSRQGFPAAAPVPSSSATTAYIRTRTTSYAHTSLTEYKNLESRFGRRPHTRKVKYPWSMARSTLSTSCSSHSDVC